MTGRLIAVLVLALLPAVASAEPKVPTFEADILPVLNAHCLQCHGGVHQKSGLDLRTLASVLKGGNGGAAVVPGKPDESPLLQKLAKDDMPKTDNKVSEANKKLLREWVIGGAKGVEKTSGPVVVRPAKKPAEVAKLIDREIDVRLSAAKVPASPRAGDAEFLRRVHLDITGKPPTATQTAAFLADPAADKRAKLIDDLLASDEYGRHFGERWVNLFRQMSANPSEWEPDKLRDWITERLNTGRGWDETVRDLFTTTGLLADNPQAGFYYFNADMQGKFEPKIMAGNVSQLFLGVQLQCAECHDHPFSDWKQKDFWGLAAFFGATSTPNNPPNTRAVRDNLPKQPPKPGTPLTISIPAGEARNAGTRVRAKFLGGEEPALDPAASARLPFAAWLTGKENRMFARTAANRLWAHFFARGFVNPLNDFADHNPPSHPALLDTLADELVSADFDLKHLIRGVCLSDAYQRTSKPAPGNDKPDADPLFARMTPKVLTPEQLYDALCGALEVPDLAPPADPKNPPKKPNPKAPPPPSHRSLFVGQFRGPGVTDEPTELKLGVPHALKLMNEATFNTGGKVVDRVLESAKSPADALEELFLAVLCRKPTADERDTFAAFVAKQKAPREAYRRVVWVLLNSSEFMLNN